MKTATLVNKKDQETMMGYTANQLHYKLSPALNGYEYVVVSAAYTTDHGPETYIFGADKNGTIMAWRELKGSFVGGLNHKQALANAGYTVKEDKSKKKTKKAAKSKKRSSK